MIFIRECCEYESNDEDRGNFGFSGKDPDHYIILHNTVVMEVKPRMEVTLKKTNSM